MMNTDDEYDVDDGYDVGVLGSARYRNNRRNEEDIPK